MTKGYINSIETFGAVDGPGVRFVVFMQGCAMRCKYCHNPETWKVFGPAASQGGQGLPGNEVTVRTPEEVFMQACRYRSYWKNGGGITVSGGEALLQIDFVTELFALCHEKGIHTALDTSGNPFTRNEPFFSKFQKLMDVTDLFILDIKQINGEKHKQLTGWDNKNILDLARYLSDNGKDMWIRHVLVPGITTDEEDLKELRKFLDTLKTVRRVEVLPYHTMGITKYEKLGIPYPLLSVNPPTDEEIQRAEQILKG